MRVDLNISSAHRWSTTFNFHTFSSVPDTLNGFEPAFPGFPVMGSQTSKRFQLANALRSTLGSSLVNEVRMGYSGAPVEFFKEQFDASLWSGSLANQAGHHLNLNGNAAGISNAGPAPNAQSRNASTLLIEDTMNWMKGSHSFSVGGSFTRADIWAKNQATVPTITFGVETVDPANAMFDTDELPRRVDGRPHPGAWLLRHDDGTHYPDRRDGPYRREHRPVHLLWSRHSARPHGRHGLSRSGQLARAAGPDAELRPPVRAAEAVLRAEQQLLHGDARRRVGRLRQRRRAATRAMRRPPRATCSNRA